MVMAEVFFHCIFVSVILFSGFFFSKGPNFLFKPNIKSIKYWPVLFPLLVSLCFMSNLYDDYCSYLLSLRIPKDILYDTEIQILTNFAFVYPFSYLF